MKLTRRRLSLFLRAIPKAIQALVDRHHPIMVHLIPIRRCNLSCAYCNEYDTFSKPVPLSMMQRRIDRLAELGTAIVTLSGGEPLMHPDLDAMIAHIRKRGMIATLITNGYYLSKERIEQLNRAGLDHLQISIDNLEPDDISMKSLRLLEPKLKWLAEHAAFIVNINSVIGTGIESPQDALAVAERASRLGFSRSLGILHDGRGQLRPLRADERTVYEKFKQMRGLNMSRVNGWFQENLAQGRPNDWSCRAGARYLYVDENGLVHYCSQQRGAPGVSIESCGRDDIRREYDTRKGCAPYCTINCVQQVAMLDNWRAPQTGVARLSSSRVVPPPSPAMGQQVLSG